MWWETVPFETPASLHSSWQENSEALPIDSSSAARRGSERARAIVRNCWSVKAGRGFVAKFDSHQTITDPVSAHVASSPPRHASQSGMRDRFPVFGTDGSSVVKTRYASRSTSLNPKPKRQLDRPSAGSVPGWAASSDVLP